MADSPSVRASAGRLIIAAARTTGPTVALDERSASGRPLVRDNQTNVRWLAADQTVGC